MTRDMNTAYRQDLWNSGADKLRNCGEGFGGRKAVAALRKDFSRFLHYAAVLILMVVGVCGAWGQGQLPFTVTTADVENLYWIENAGATGFYAVPHSNNQNASTTNAPTLRALWYFKESNEGGYYYIINKETEKYLKKTGKAGEDNTIQVADYDEGDDAKFMFSFGTPEGVEQGNWVIYPKDASSNDKTGWLSKKSGNLEYNKWLKASTWNDTPVGDLNSQWKIVPRANIKWPQSGLPFVVSINSDKHYYNINHVRSSTYNVSYDDNNNVTISNVDDEKKVWYFKEAAADPNNPNIDNLKYYYIINASSEKYLKFTAATINGSNQDNIFVLSDYDSGNEDRFQFVVVNSYDNQGNSWYSIMPKLAMSKYDVSKYANSMAPSSVANNEKLDLRSDRNTDKGHWVFKALWADPVVTCDETGTITITGEDGAAFYYTTDGSTVPTTANSQYNANSKPTVSAGITTIKVRAIGGEKSDSRVITQKIVYVPNQTFESTYDGTAQTPVVKVGETTISSDEYNISYKLGGTDVTECKNSGTYTVTITDKDGGEYIVYGSGSFTINPASVTLTANSKNTDVYDGTEKTVTGFTCKKGEQTIEGLTFTGVSASGKGTNAGTYDVTFTGVTLNTTKDATGNYVVTETTNGTLTINRKDVTITAKSKSKTYDGTALTESGFEATALETGDTHSFTVVMTDESTITNADTQPNVIAKVDGFAVTTGNATDVGNYKVTTANGTLTISKKDVTISGITAKNKVYDGNTTATLVYTGVIFTGKLDGENLTVSATGTFADKTAGTGKTVTISGLTLGGSGAGNYAPAASGQQETTTADITVKEVTATGTITAKNKEYDGKTTAVLNYTGVTLTGKVEGDDLNVSATGTFADKNIGTGKTVNISEWVLAGTDKDNYRMASSGQPTTTTADITVANITVSGITAKNKVYDGTTTAELDYTNVTLTGKVEGESLTVTATGAFADKNVGTDKTVNITGLTLGGTDKNNYQLASTGQQTTAKANITAKEITISGITASNKEYDGNTTATLVYTGVAYSGKLDGENLTVTATGAFADKNVGTDKTVNITGLTLGGADASNYTLPTTGQQETTKANITAAPVTVTAENKTKGYGDSDPTFTWTVTGLKGSDTKDVLTVTISRETGEDVRDTPYTITPAGGATQGNYAVAYVTGTLTITAKAIGDGTNPAVGIDIDVTYDGTNYTVTVKQGDNTLATTNYTWSGAEDQDHPENYVVTVSGQGNYNNSAKATYTKLTFWDTTPDQTLTSETTAAVYCATQNLKVNESFEAYYVTNLADNTLTLTKVEAGDNKKNYIPANQPLLLISDAATAPKGFTVKPYTDTDVVTIPASGEGSNLLKVVTDEGGLAVALTQVYIFSQGEFVLTKAGPMSKGKFYLENPNYSTPAPSRSIIRITTEGTTDINTAQYIDNDSQHSDTWYSIGGQKLNKKPTRKGLYLQNGKKVVIK